MARQSFVVLVLLLTESLSAAEPCPPEVAQYIERREICEHFRQEPWPEGGSLEERKRRRFLAGQFSRYCKGSDQVLRELKSRYKNHPSVMNRLGKFDAAIEGRE